MPRFIKMWQKSFLNKCFSVKQIIKVIPIIADSERISSESKQGAIILEIYVKGQVHSNSSHRYNEGFYNNNSSR